MVLSQNFDLCGYIALGPLTRSFLALNIIYLWLFFVLAIVFQWPYLAIVSQMLYLAIAL